MDFKYYSEDPVQAFFEPKDSGIVYEEGIYVGYRYHSTFNVETSYEFGYGLSFTTFDYSNISLSSETFSGEIAVSVEVRNSGSVPGKEAVQLYLSAPVKELHKPAIELKGFAKTRLLQPGESQNLSFILSARNLSSFHPDVSTWIAESGDYEVKIGASSNDIRQTATFTLEDNIEVKKENAVLLPAEEISEMKPSK